MFAEFKILNGLVKVAGKIWILTHHESWLTKQVSQSERFRQNSKNAIFNGEILRFSHGNSVQYLNFRPWSREWPEKKKTWKPISGLNKEFKKFLVVVKNLSRSQLKYRLAKEKHEFAKKKFIIQSLCRLDRFSGFWESLSLSHERQFQIDYWCLYRESRDCFSIWRSEIFCWSSLIW